jgi:beta-lactamase regulating signal transducer with metallopeptidase domain
MIAGAIVYAALMALLFAGAAACSERLLAELGRPRRLAWLASFAASVAVPVITLLLAANAPPAREGTQRLLWEAIVPNLSGQAATASVPASWANHNWDSTLLWLWASATVSMLIVLALAWFRLARCARHWQAAETDHGPVRVTDSVGPAVFGIREPCVLLPRWLLSAPPAMRATVMAHELEHIAARDHLLLVSARLTAILLPWNLPLWWLLHRLRSAIEMDCDARVLRRGIDPAAYGEVLLQVSQHRSAVPLGAAALTEPVSQLERRIRVMLSEKRPPTAKLALGLVASIALLAACATRLEPPAIRSATNAQRASETASSVQLEVSRIEITSVTTDNVGPGRMVAPGAVAEREFTLLSDAILRAPDGAIVSIAADRTQRGNGETVFAGNVRIDFEQMQITTPKAVVRFAQEGDTIITMDTAALTRVGAP